MRRHLLATAGLLALASPLVAACGESESDRLAETLTGSAAVDLYAPELDGDEPTSWTVRPDGSVTLSYGKGFSPTITLREASPGDLCAGREPDWDVCDRLDDEAVLLGFEEMNAVVVRRAGTELFLSNISLEVPDENFESHEALRAWQDDYVNGLVEDVREAESLTPEEFVEQVPDGKVEKAG